MKLSLLLNEMEHRELIGSGDPDIAGIAYDSRMVKPGFLFFALPGMNRDGNQFVQDAVERGAAAIVSEESRMEGRANAVFVSAPDARRAMAQAACFFFDRPSEKLRVIGITGTNGKTTVALMIREILSSAGQRPGVIGTINYEIGERRIPAMRTTPESPDVQNLLSQMVRAGCESVVMEVSSHALVQQRVSGIAFDAVIFTNLTHDHLDYHGSMESYFESKTLLFPPLTENKKDLVAIINIDDPWGAKLAEIVRGGGGNPISYGTRPDSSVRAAETKVGAEGSSVHVTSPWGEADLSLRMLGRFNVSNGLAAFACCGALGIKTNAIARSLSKMDAVRGRLEKVDAGAGINLFVDYAHTEDALKNVLTSLREITSGRLIVVFGCGGNRDRSKRPLMGSVVARLADYAILTSDNPRKEKPSDIISEIEQGFENRSYYEVVEDRRKAIARGVELARPGDVVLIAGKGHENYQETADRTIPFDDAEVAREILSAGRSEEE